MVGGFNFRIPKSHEERELDRVAAEKALAATVRRVRLDVFHNNLRKMLNLDRCQLEAAGVLDPADPNAWWDFRRDPFQFFIKADEPTVNKLWDLMEARR